jgi:hypothetical protein
MDMTELDLDQVLLPQVAQLAEAGGGWANWNDLPGGDEWVQGAIDRGLLRYEDGFVQLAAKS